MVIQWYVAWNKNQDKIINFVVIDLQAAPNTQKAILYEEGVRFGCWGMSIYAASCSVYSLTVTKLMKWLG